jgi:hypothetical protein
MSKQPAFKLLFVLTALFASTSSASAEAVMRAGAWQTFVTIFSYNLVTGKEKLESESSSKLCMTQSYVDKRPYLKPGIDKEQMLRQNAKCTISNEEVTENSASWKMKCEMQGGTVDSDIHNNVSKDEFWNLVTQLVQRGGNASLMKITMTGRFIGECTEDMQKLQ